MITGMLISVIMVMMGLAFVVIGVIMGTHRLDRGHREMEKLFTQYEMNQAKHLAFLEGMDAYKRNYRKMKVIA